MDFKGSKEIFMRLQQAREDLFTGKIVVENHTHKEEYWEIYLSLGRTFWVTGNYHRVRRWLRVLRQNCPQLLSKEWMEIASEAEAKQPDQEYIWELSLLEKAIEKSTISLVEAQEIVRTYINENFSSVIDYAEIQCQFISLKDLPSQFLLLDADHIEESSFAEYTKQHKHIHASLQNLPFKFSLDLAPEIKSLETLKTKVSENAFQALTKYLTGKNTLRDIAVSMNRGCDVVLQSLIPLFQSNIISFREVNDFAFPSKNKPQVSTPSQSKYSSSLGLIACIDDSPVIGEQIKAILKPLGYEVLTILDPTKEFSKLLTAKPDLIFLDLIMPNTNGYEICTYLRKTSQFRDLPIVMLTGHDGIVDKLRAKVAGSTDFLSKPPKAEEVRKAVKEHLEKALTSVSQ